MDKIAVENDLDVFIESAGIFAEDGQGARLKMRLKHL